MQNIHKCLFDNRAYQNGFNYNQNENDVIIQKLSDKKQSYSVGLKHFYIGKVSDNIVKVKK